MTLLMTFAGLCMCCTALMALLPEGSLKKTALLAAGLLMASLWAEGLPALLQCPLPDAAEEGGMLCGVETQPMDERRQQLALEWQEVGEDGQAAGMAAP